MGCECDADAVVSTQKTCEETLPRHRHINLLSGGGDPQRPYTERPSTELFPTLIDFRYYSTFIRTFSARKRAVTAFTVCQSCSSLSCYSNTTVYYGIHKHRECIPVKSAVTNLIHGRCSCVDFTLEVEANVARCVHSSVNKPGVKSDSGL